MNWKHKAALCVLLAAIAMGALATAIAGGASDAVSAPPYEPVIAASHTTTPQPEPAAEPTPGESGYVLKALDGRVAVFLQGGRTPILVTNIEMKTLREIDRKLIEVGLSVAGQAELMELLEDLGS